MDNTHPSRFTATVIGAGPAGLAVIGKLLDHKPEVTSILWVDPHFNSGRLSNYPEVPSNTKVKFFIKYLNNSTALKAAAEDAKKGLPERGRTSIFEVMEGMDQEKGSSLSCAIEMVKDLTDKLFENHKGTLTKKMSFVTKMEREKESASWKIHTRDGDIFVSDLVFLASGAEPNELADCYDGETTEMVGNFSPESQYILLDDSLKPSKLKDMIKSDDTVAIFGSSHSAMLALKNMVELPEGVRPARIYNFYKHDLKYAVFMDGWILYDNTGLKGEVAEWARTKLESGSIEGVTRVRLGAEPMGASDVQAITKYVMSIGYKRNALPQLIIDKEEVEERNITYDPTTANLVIKKAASADKLPTMFGYGIGFPRRVVDPYGNVEYAVGMWKFMDYVSNTVPNVMTEYFKNN